MLTPETEILISKDGKEIARHVVQPGDYVIGREAGCEIKLDVEMVSRRHALLTVNYDHALIEDLGSSNGTFVNQQPVKEAVRLWPNQKIQIGAATIELRKVKMPSSSAHSLPPTEAALQRLLPEEFLRDKKYEIGGVVARGGMGAILKAREATTDRTVAMKVILDAPSSESLVRFIAEAKVTAQLEHPNIVPVHELSVDENGQPYYTMKFVRGETLRHVFQHLASGDAERRKRFSASQLLTIFQKVCDAVAFAHSKRVIHRDLKPENVMIGDFGEVLVMDWGLAKVLGKLENAGTEALLRSVVRTVSDPAGAEGTMAGSVMGTPQYMSPEQARGESESLDSRTDIYALGAILFHLLYLQPPVSGTDAMEVVEKVAAGAVEWPTAKAAAHLKLPHFPGGRVPDSLEAVCRKALAADRDRRYANVSDLQRDLTAYQTGFATGAEKAGAWKQVKLLVKRNKALALGLVSVLIVGGVFGTRAILEGRRAERGELAARQQRDRAEGALADLKKQAPALRQLADSEAGFQRFPSALEKLDAALALDPSHLPSYWRRAWLLVGMERFRDAADAIHLAQQKDPASANLAAILPMIEQLASAPAAERWNQDRASAMMAHLQLVGASGEVVALSGRLQLGAAAKLKLVNDRLRQWLGPNVHAGVSETGGIVFNPPTNIDTVEPLRGLPITNLGLGQTRVVNLDPLRGMPLITLFLNGTKVSDISPLRGMRLQELSLDGSLVIDLSPLKGMALRSLKANHTKINDIAPLRGMPLVSLDLGDSAVRDLSPLKGIQLRVLRVGPDVGDISPLQGMPLEELDLPRSAINFSPLRGMPLKKLSGASLDFGPLEGMSLESLTCAGSYVTDFSTLRGLRLGRLDVGNSKMRDVKPLIGLEVKVLNISNDMIRDLTPLLRCSELEELIAKNCSAPIEPLRAHMTLKVIDYNASGTPESFAKPVAQFWKEYDAQQADAQKKAGGK